MVRKKLSIIIPCYNVDDNLNILMSVILSSYDKSLTEVICIDDGSTDGTSEILNKYSDRIKIIKLEHSGVSAARNVGLNSANGEWIWFVDADDLLFDDSFKTIKKYWDNKTSDVLFFGAKVINNPMAEKKIKDIEPKNEIFVGKEVFSNWINRYHHPFVWNCLYRTEFLRNKDIRFANNLHVGEDMAFQMSVFTRAEEVETINSYIYIYRYLINNKSIMYNALNNNLIPLHIQVLDVVLKQNTRILDKHDCNLLYEWANRYVIESCFKNPQYLSLLVKVWRKNRAKYPYKGFKNRIKAILLYSRLFSYFYMVYKKFNTKTPKI